MFERIMFNQIHNHFSIHNLFYSGQCGFRTNDSAQFAALELIDRITQDLHQGNIPITIVMDLSKAFDTLNHDILINKLKSFGLSETALKLMQSYLTYSPHFPCVNRANSPIYTRKMWAGPHKCRPLQILFCIYTAFRVDRPTLSR